MAEIPSWNVTKIYADERSQKILESQLMFPTINAVRVKSFGEYENCKSY